MRLVLQRGSVLLPWRTPSEDGEAPVPASEVIAAAGLAGSRPGSFLLGGGNPLARADLEEILSELAAIRPTGLGLCLSGRGLSESGARELRVAGAKRVVVPFHCARQDAHDWLVGESGALRTAHRAVRLCADAGLVVAAEVVLTRPTMPHLAETVEVLARSGVRYACVRRLLESDTDPVSFVSLSPRFSLLETSLEQAAAMALRRGIRLVFRDLPACVAPRLKALFAPAYSETWLLPDGTVHLRGRDGVGCADCPGWPRCCGAPADYVARFGWEEFTGSAAARADIGDGVTDQPVAASSEILVFDWRGPRRVRCDACGDPTPAGSSGESTRAVRARLVHAAARRPGVLRLVGADLLAHPQATLLIQDAVRLFANVEVAGEASALVDWSDLDLRRVDGLRRIDVAFYGPDAAAHDAHCGMPGAFAAALRGIERVCTHTKIAVGAYAVLHDARWVEGFADAWNRGRLPGEPRFRLSQQGASLADLTRAALALAPGPARAALLAVLPRCSLPPGDGAEPGAAEHAARQARSQLRWDFGRGIPWKPCGSDPEGAFEPCREDPGLCAASGCAGCASGWQNETRTEKWTMSL